MADEKKKALRCQSCKKLEDKAWAAQGSPRRLCDGCGRETCRHLAKHTPPDHDLCGPCNLEARREAAEEAGGGEAKGESKKKTEEAGGGA